MRTHVCPVGSNTGSLKHLKEIGQKNVAGAPASAARTSRSLLSGPSGRIPAMYETQVVKTLQDRDLLGCCFRMPRAGSLKGGMMHVVMMVVRS